MNTVHKMYDDKIEDAFHEYCLQRLAKLKLRQVGYKEDIKRCSTGLEQVEKQIEEFNMDTCREEFNEAPYDEHGCTKHTQAIKSMTGGSYGNTTNSKINGRPRGR